MESFFNGNFNLIRTRRNEFDKDERQTGVCR